MATNRETRKHIKNVAKYLKIVIRHLRKRATEHDATKLASPELELFTEYTPKLAGCTYGSEEYKGFLEALKPALDHHYASSSNRHHPEHFLNGVDDMTLIDLLEMFCDWASSCKRMKNGNLLKSVEMNKTRFKMSPQLTKIFRNTANMLEIVENK